MLDMQIALDVRENGSSVRNRIMTLPGNNTILLRASRTTPLSSTERRIVVSAFTFALAW